ncbi:MAG: phosphatase PAP2 family protein [Acidimicrobiales bacterium]
MTPLPGLPGIVKVLWPKGLNTAYYLDLNNFSRHTAWAHGFMHAYALWLGLTLLTVLFLCVYGTVWWRRDLHAAARMGLGGLGTFAALGLNQLVGHAAQEQRPYDTWRHALVIVGRAHDYAFPSDHAVVAGAILTSVLLVVRRGWVSDVLLALVAAVLALFLCFARVYVGAHYPGDVVAGLLLGAAVVLVVSALRPVAYRIVDGLIATVLSFLVCRASGAGASVEDLHPSRQHRRISK